MSYAQVKRKDGTTFWVDLPEALTRAQAAEALSGFGMRLLRPPGGAPVAQFENKDFYSGQLNWMWNLFNPGTNPDSLDNVDPDNPLNQWAATLSEIPAFEDGGPLNRDEIQIIRIAPAILNSTDSTSSFFNVDRGRWNENGTRNNPAVALPTDRTTGPQFNQPITSEGQLAERDFPGAVFRKWLTDPKTEGGYGKPGFTSGPLRSIPEELGSGAMSIRNILGLLGTADKSEDPVSGVRMALMRQMGFPRGAPGFRDFLNTEGLLAGQGLGGGGVGVPGAAASVLASLAGVPLGGKDATIMSQADPRTAEAQKELYDLMTSAALNTGVSPFQAGMYRRSDVRQRIMDEYNDMLLRTAELGEGTPRRTWAQFLADRVGIRPAMPVITADPGTV